MTPPDILATLKKWPNKQFGQHFLTDESVLASIVGAAELRQEDTVVEIGSGLGALTFELTRRAARVLAIEADADLAEYLRRKNIANLTVVTGDALQIDWTVTLKGAYKIVANIPYSITSPLLRKIFSLDHKPTVVVLLIQKEVADRLVAEPGNNDRGYLTVLIEAAATTRLIETVSAESFYPVPTVNSAVVRLLPRETPVTNQIFWPAVEAAFRHKRQMISNSLFDLPLPKDKILQLISDSELKPTLRPADLSLADWQRLSWHFTEALGS